MSEPRTENGGGFCYSIAFIYLNLRIRKILEWPWIVTQHEDIYSNKGGGRETGLAVVGIGEREDRAPEMTERQERLFLTKSVLKNYLEWKMREEPCYQINI